MKIKRFLSLVLALALSAQLIMLPVFATEAENSSDPTESTEATQPAQPEPDLPQSIDFGSASILQGCRTIDGMVPLAGSERRLESAQSVFVYDRKTETVIYSYNPDAKLAPGTLSKLVTALIVIEQCKLDEIVTCSSKNISKLPKSQNVNLKDSEQLTVDDLLHCLILQSANDAAVALSEYVAGNMQSFVTLMNERVKKMGCTSTEFYNVHGLDNPAQYTTARDMARIYCEAMKNDTFAELLSCTNYTVPETNRSAAREFQSQNYMVDKQNIIKYKDDRATSGLPSHTNSAGSSLVCTAENKYLDLVCVIMGAHRVYASNGWSVTYYGNFDEMTDLFEFVFNNFKSNRVICEDMAFDQLEVTGGECNVVVAPKVNYDSVLPADCQMSNLIKYYHQENGALIAPIKKGDLIATVELNYKNSCIAEVELYAMNDVKAVEGSTQASAQSDSEKGGFLSVVVTICLVVLALAAVYLGVNSMRRAIGRAKRRRRRANRRRSW